MWRWKLPASTRDRSGQCWKGSLSRCWTDDPQQLAQLARGRLKDKIPQLEQALEGRVRDHHRFLLAEYPDEWEALGQRILRMEAEIDKHIGPFEAAAAKRPGCGSGDGLQLGG